MLNKGQLKEEKVRQDELTNREWVKIYDCRGGNTDLEPKECPLSLQATHLIVRLLFLFWCFIPLFLLLLLLLLLVDEVWVLLDYHADGGADCLQLRLALQKEGMVGLKVGLRLAQQVCPVLHAGQNWMTKTDTGLVQYVVVEIDTCGELKRK